MRKSNENDGGNPSFGNGLSISLQKNVSDTINKTTEQIEMVSSAAKDSDYIFNRSSGHEYIDHNCARGKDKIVFGEGITKDDIIVRGESKGDGYVDTVVIYLREEGKDYTELKSSLTINYFFNEYANIIQTLQFSDGTVLSVADVVNMLEYSSVSISNRESEVNLNLKKGPAYISSGDFDDVINSGDGDTVIYAGEGNNIITGGRGDDEIHTGKGDDTFIFNRGDGHDIIYDDGGNNTLIFGEGITKDDLILNVSDNNLIIYLREEGKEYYEVLNSITINNIFNNDNKIETIKFSDGSQLTRPDIFSLIEATNMSLNYTEGAVNLNLKKGPAYISSGDFDDVINAGDGDTVIDAGDGNNIITGGRGNDEIRIGEGDNTFIFNRGDGHDVIKDYSYHGISRDYRSNNTIVFGEGITKDDIIICGYAKCNGYNTVVIYLREEGKDYTELKDSITIDYLLNNFINRYADIIKTLQFTDGTVLNVADMLNMIEYSNISIDNSESEVNLNLKKGPNSISSGDFDDVINAGDGDSYIYAGEGNNIITGGRGDDEIHTGKGDDTFIFNRGDGHDVIEDEGGNNTLIFGEGITKNDLLFNFVEDYYRTHLIIYIREEGKDYTQLSDRIVIKGRYNFNGAVIQNFQFSDGSTLTYQEVVDIAAGQKSDFRINSWPSEIHKGREDDIIVDYDGDSYIDAGNGNNTITGGRGDDRIYAGEGDDTYIFNRGDGHDFIEDKGGNNKIIFGEGITKDDLIFDSELRDYSHKLVIYIREEGKELHELSDRIVINNFRIDFYRRDSYQFIETIQFSDGSTIGISDILNMLESSEIDIRYSIGGPDALNINLKKGPDYIYGSSYDDVINAGDGNTLINAYGGNNIITGGRGNDDISAGEGDDTYIFNRGDGCDVIKDRGGDDTIIFGKGITKNDLVLHAVKWRGLSNLIIYICDKDKQSSESDDSITIKNFFSSDGRIENFRFSDGSFLSRPELINLIEYSEVDLSLNTDSFNINLKEGYGEIRTGAYDDVINAGAGSVTIHAGNGNNTITAGRGNDRIYAGTGNDTYHFNRGDGQDFIQDDGGDDKIIFGKGITQKDLIFHAVRNGDDHNLVIYLREEGKDINELSDRIVIKDFFHFDARQIETFQFADGSVLTSRDIPDLLDYVDPDVYRARTHMDFLVDFYNTGRPDVIITGDGDDIIDAPEGDYIIIAGNGDNTINSGSGDDKIYSGSGNDTYIFNRGDGHDFIRDEGGNDTIIFGKGITKDDLLIYVDEDNMRSDLVIKLRDDHYNIYGLNDSIRIYDFFSRELTKDQRKLDTKIENFIFSDGSILTVEDILSMIKMSYGSVVYDEGAVNLNLRSAGEYISTGDFDDVINAGDGDTVIYAGGGNNIITGGRGNDEIHTGDGDDTFIFNYGDGHDVIYDDGGNNTVMFGGGISRYDLIFKAVRNEEHGNSLVVYLREYGKDLKDLQNSITIPDFFNGNKIETFQLSDGTILNTAYILSQLKYLDVDVEYDQGEVFMDLIECHSSITTGDFDDIINAGDGDSVIYAGYGNNIITGGPGNDEINTGIGDDTFIFNRGDGHDAIHDHGGNNTIVFGKGITKDDLLLGRVDFTELVIYLKEGDKGADQSQDSITISSFLFFDREKSYTLMFSDGSTLSQTDIIAMIEYCEGRIIYNIGGININLKEGPEHIRTGRYDDVINAGDGDSYIDAGNGNNTITGGRGNDRIYTGEGDDTFIFNRGDGRDVINDDGGTDVVKLYGVDKSDFGLIDTNMGVALSYGDDDYITFYGNLERIELGDGSYLDSSAINYIVQCISSFSDKTGTYFSTATDVRNNDYLNNLIATQWQAS